MSESVNLPALGESVTEGTVTRWLKQVGDRVEVDEPLLEVSTDKVDTEIPSPIAGIIEEILVAEDETAEVGAPLVRIGDGSGSASAEEAPAAEEPAAEEPAAEAPAAEAAAPPKSPAAEAPSDCFGRRRPRGHAARPRRERHRRYRHPLAEGVGDTVEVDEPLLEVSTDKVDTEIPSPVAGTLQEIRVQRGRDGRGRLRPRHHRFGLPQPRRQLPAGTGPRQEAPKQEAPKQEAPAEAPKQEAPEHRQAPARGTEAGSPQAGGTGSEAPAESGYVTPLVRKLANQQGVDIASLTGTGVGGRIRKQDVLAAAEAKAAPAAPSAPASAPASAPSSAAASSLRGTVQKAPRIRQVIARRMRESLDTSTQLTQVHEVDMTKVAKLRTRGQGLVPGPERLEADVPALHCQGCRRGPEAAPEGQRCPTTRTSRKSRTTTPSTWRSR